MQINDLKKFLNQAEQDLNKSSELLNELAHTQYLRQPLTPTDPDTIHIMQLMLQYRLDTQKALHQLSGIQHYLLQLLGIESQHSDLLNRERLAFALGSDDLQHVLTMLNHLLDSLLRIIAHNQLKEVLDKKKALERVKQQKLQETMIRVLDKQNSFATKMDEFKLALHQLSGALHEGVIYDHIAALQGPISRFYQALQNGLALIKSLNPEPEHAPDLQYQPAQKPDQNLSLFHSTPSHQKLFKPLTKHTEPEYLEQRASTKRLGHFFNH
ncbi:hypothetical protein [Legionella worsleiensis]|uniref:Uncharacterized protein n=1 Tax=Legionella worsleiensis TaxID=45076 RepID=A0A0W1AJ59_9GAMM|nr:hypothetical protein [Legionella worsleiensis]KTD81272.1 hypothetical protein Lwor_0773 [Legionella worsleiensis]STY30857.1 Uncharacterised protein [Legionella worsleiensis]